MTIHDINKDGKITPYKKTPVSKESDIEDLIEKNPEFLEKGLIIIARQMITSDGKRVDLMGLDENGNVVIIELKKGNAARKVMTQILDYAVWAKNLKYEDVNSIYKKRSSTDFSTLNEKCQKWTNENEFNKYPKLYVIGEKIELQTERLALYLQSKDIDINCIEMNFYELDGRRVCNRKDVVVGENTRVGNSMPPRTEDDHLSHGEPIVHELYNSLKPKVCELGSDITVNSVKSYIGFVRHGKVFLSVKIKKESLTLELQVQNGFEDPKKVIQQSHPSRENLKRLVFEKKKELDDIMHLVKQAYTTI